MTSFGNQLNAAIASGAAAAQPTGADAEIRRDAMFEATLAQFEASFAGIDGADVVGLHPGGLDRTGNALTREVVGVGSLRLVHSLTPMGNSLPNGRNAVGKESEQYDGDPLTAIDHFIQKYQNGNLSTAFIPRNPVNPPNVSNIFSRSKHIPIRGGSTETQGVMITPDPDAAEKERRNSQIDEAADRYNAWQIIYTDTTVTEHPEIRFAAVLPSAEGVDAAAVPTADDIMRTITEIQAASAGRTIELENPLRRFGE